MNDIQQAALNVLKEFIIKMNYWEDNYRDKFRESSQYDEEIKSELKIIFDKYCTIKERKYGYPNQISIGWPPEYSPDEEILSVVELKKNRIQIKTQRVLYKTLYEYRYTLHYKNQEWRIDKKEKYDPELEKWVKWLL